MKSRIALALIALLSSTACLFLPAIQDDGYVSCTSDADCAVGRSCAVDVGLCAPPPWHDTAFLQRRAILVTNPADVELAAGTAVAVQVGGDTGVLALTDVGVDARYVDFVDGAWREVPVFIDRFDDRFTVWAALTRAVPPGATDILMYLEQKTADGTPTVVEAPAQTFALFDELDDFPTDEVGGERYLISAPGASAPVVGESKVGVGDNVTVIWRAGFVPPLSVTFKARVIGLNCQEVFVGVTGADRIGFNPPSAGFFIDTDLQTTAEVAPTTTSNPTPLSAARLFSESPNSLHRFTVDVDGDFVRLAIDGVVFDERAELRPAFDADVSLFPTVQVGGACSIEIETMWVTPLPAKAPVVSVEDRIDLNIIY